MPFTSGHTTLLGRKLSPQWRENIRKSKLGAKNPAYKGTLVEGVCLKCGKAISYWPPFIKKYCSRLCANYKGDNAKYIAKHQRIYKKWGKADKCEACKTPGRNYTWANISKAYNTDDRNDWIKLCRSCHTKFDRYNYSLKELGYGT